MANTPDPLESLSAYEKQLLLAMAPSQNERWRISPVKGAAARADTILQFLIERRSLYEKNFKNACRTANIDPPKFRNHFSEDRLRSYKAIINQALSVTTEHRSELDRTAWSMREGARIRDAQNRGERVLTNEEYNEARQDKRERRRFR